MAGACLICKVGIPSLVTNSCISGIVCGALKTNDINQIYVADNGLYGLLNSKLFDASAEQNDEMIILKTTPGFSFTSHDTVDDVEISENQKTIILECLKRYSIKYLIFIGNSEYIETYLSISRFARDNYYQLNTIFIPECIDNNMILTDHCVGYGSTAKSVILAVHELCSKLSKQDHIHFIKIKENGSGWLTASSAIANFDENGPDLICLSAETLIADNTISQIKRVYQEKQSCIIAIPINITTDTIESISSKLPQCQIVVHEIYPTELCYVPFVSQADCEESYMSGKAAVENVVNSKNPYILGLLRGYKDNHYASKTKLKEATSEFSAIRTFPASWIVNNKVSQDYLDYVLPLIQGDINIEKEHMLPRYARLKKKMIK